ncbi:ribokinase [Sporichthya brevicatena]|uniref:Ribokinase n=1 Tax=Sporichthya brevicatena TaxID=171442 RepID=A0ABP3RFB3_9ACTN
MGAVLALGSVNADFVVRTESSPAGPGSLAAHSLLRTSGGKAGNRAVLAARLGAPARLLAGVGDDDLAAQALRGPEAAGVNLRAVRRRPGPTGYASIVVPADGGKTILRVPNANDAWGEDEAKVALEVDAAPDGSVVTVDCEVPVALVRAALEAARERGFVTVLDPAPPTRVSDELLALTDHLTPDHTEAKELTGIAVSGPAEAARAAEALRARGAAVVHVKLAGGGCVTATADGVTLIEAPDAEVVDATGAGDAFAGALAVALLAGRSALDAAASAVAAATCAVTGYGSQESYPDPAALAPVLAAVQKRIRPLPAVKKG